MGALNAVVLALTALSLLAGLMAFSWRLFRRLDRLVELPEKVDRLTAVVEAQGLQIRAISNGRVPAA